MLDNLWDIIKTMAGALLALAGLFLLAILGVLVVFVGYFFMWGILGLLVLLGIVFLIWAAIQEMKD